MVLVNSHLKEGLFGIGIRGSRGCSTCRRGWSAGSAAAGRCLLSTGTTARLGL